MHLLRVCCLCRMFTRYTRSTVARQTDDLPNWNALITHVRVSGSLGLVTARSHPVQNVLSPELPVSVWRFTLPSSPFLSFPRGVCLVFAPQYLHHIFFPIRFFLYALQMLFHRRLCRWGQRSRADSRHQLAYNAIPHY